jgi:hypothetical protein
MALYGYVMSMTWKVIYSVRGGFGSAEGHRECDSLDRLDSFPVEAIEGIRQFSELLSIKTHLIKGCEEGNFSLTPVANEDFGYVPSIDVDCGDHGVSMWERG